MTVGIALRVNGVPVDVVDEGGSLLDLLREQLRIRSVKDGCSPQGQCGCCTVLVDGAPRVACVTPVARLADRDITTLEGLDADVRQRWVEAFTATGASQCGFCTPGIIVRLSALDRLDEASVGRALLPHLCRCTGWRTILEAVGRRAERGRAGLGTRLATGHARRRSASTGGARGRSGRGWLR